MNNISQLREEVRLWNTPMIGGYLLWRFTDGFTKNHQHGDSPVSLLHFFATAILTSPKLSHPISNRRENLQSYVKSFEENKDIDVLLSIQKRIEAKKEYTLSSIDVGVTSGLLAWDIETAKLFACELKKKPRSGKALKAEVVKSGNKAEILGKWFSEHEVKSIATYLKVVL